MPRIVAHDKTARPEPQPWKIRQGIARAEVTALSPRTMSRTGVRETGSCSRALTCTHDVSEVERVYMLLELDGLPTRQTPHMDYLRALHAAGAREGSSVATEHDDGVAGIEEFFNLDGKAAPLSYAAVARHSTRSPRRRREASGSSGQGSSVPPRVRSRPASAAIWWNGIPTPVRRCE